MNTKSKETTGSNLGLNKAQMEWAKQHDWFVEAFVNSFNLYTVVTRPAFEGDTETVFTNFKELKDWAGY